MNRNKYRIGLVSVSVGKISSLKVGTAVRVLGTTE